MVALLLLVSFLCIGGLFALADSAPQEAVWVGLACYFAILARLAQSEQQHNKLVGALKHQTELLSDKADDAVRMR